MYPLANTEGPFLVNIQTFDTLTSKTHKLRITPISERNSSQKFLPFMCLCLVIFGTLFYFFFNCILGHWHDHIRDQVLQTSFAKQTAEALTTGETERTAELEFTSTISYTQGTSAALSKTSTETGQEISSTYIQTSSVSATVESTTGPLNPTYDSPEAFIKEKYPNGTTYNTYNCHSGGYYVDLAVQSENGHFGVWRGTGKFEDLAAQQAAYECIKELHHENLNEVIYEEPHAPWPCEPENGPTTTTERFQETTFTTM